MDKALYRKKKTTLFCFKLFKAVYSSGKQESPRNKKVNFVILDARYFIFLHFYVHIFFLSFLILICGKPAK